VIDVSMAQDHSVDAAGIERQLSIELPGFGSSALEHAGVEEGAGAGRFE
jgi:hypothetical protein